MEHKKTAILIALFWTISIAYFSLKTITIKQTTFLHFDKIVHFVFYFVFVILWKWVQISNTKNSSLKLKHLFIIAILFGVFIEFLQHFFTKNRYAEITDVIANTIGAAFGYFLLHIVLKNKIEKI